MPEPVAGAKAGKRCVAKSDPDQWIVLFFAMPFSEFRHASTPRKEVTGATNGESAINPERWGDGSGGPSPNHKPIGTESAPITVN